MQYFTQGHKARIREGAAISCCFSVNCLTFFIIQKFIVFYVMCRVFYSHWTKRFPSYGDAVNGYEFERLPDSNLLHIECFDSERYVVWYQMNTDFEGRV